MGAECHHGTRHIMAVRARSRAGSSGDCRFMPTTKHERSCNAISIQSDPRGGGYKLLVIVKFSPVLYKYARTLFRCDGVPLSDPACFSIAESGGVAPDDDS